MNEREVKAEVWLPLTQGQVAVIDFDDFEKVRGTKWYAMKAGRNFYAMRKVQADGKEISILLHRFLTNCSPELEIHHVNGDGLDNRQENMRVCTRQQHTFARRRKSAGASSEYRGVHWHKRNKNWRAEIQQYDKKIHLGSFASEESAARAYDTKARELFGEYASLNFPGE